MPTLQHKSKNYKEFVQKFERKKTTDDCYTPYNIYKIVADYVANNFKINPERFVRPFYPGSDYESFDYSGGKVVVDNPPFSILSDIIDFYNAHGIPFFLFCNGLTSMGLRNSKRFGFVIIKQNIKFENGAKLKIAFVSNLFRGIVLDGVLSDEINEAQKMKMPPTNKRKSGQMNSANLITRVQHGSVEYLPPDAYEIDKVDSEGKILYGGAIRIKEGSDFHAFSDFSSIRNDVSGYMSDD